MEVLRKSSRKWSQKCKYVENRRERKDLASEAMKPVLDNHPG